MTKKLKPLKKRYLSIKLMSNYKTLEYRLFEQFLEKKSWNYELITLKCENYKKKVHFFNVILDNIL